MTYGNLPPGWQPGPYGPPPGQFGPVGYGGPPPSSRGPKLWLAASGVVLVAAVVVIVLVLTSGGGGSGTQAGGTPTPTGSVPTTSTSTTPTPTPTSTTPTSQTASPTATLPSGVTSVGPAAGQQPPTDDRLPNNSGSSSCDRKGYPDLVTVSVVTVLGLADKGEQPNSYITNVLRDCTSAAVRAKISALFGTDIDYHTGSDLTGGDGKGATAAYLLRSKDGVESLRVTLTRQRDGHYEVTSYVYNPGR